MAIYSQNVTVGLPRSLSDKLTVLNAAECPFLAMVPKGPDVDQLKYEWPLDKYISASDTAIPEGTDVTDFGNPNADYAVVSNRIQWVRPTAVKIGKLAATSVKQAGIANQKAYAIKKKLDELWRSIEAIHCSDNEVQAGSSQVPDKVRGVGTWLSTSITTSGYDVPTSYLPGSGQVSTTATASLTELGTTSAAINYLLYQTYLATGKSTTNYKGLVGGLLKSAFTAFTRVSAGSTNVMASVRTYQQTDLSKVNWNVSRFEGDFGTIDLIPSVHLAAWTSNAPQRRGYFLDMPLWDIVWKQMPKVMPLGDDGGGEKFAVDAIIGNRCYHPGGNFAIKSTS